jgi:hypothetical protein
MILAVSLLLTSLKWDSYGVVFNGTFRTAAPSTIFLHKPTKTQSTAENTRTPTVLRAELIGGGSPQ